jgi:hypothetical protein
MGSMNLLIFCYGSSVNLGFLKNPFVVLILVAAKTTDPFKENHKNCSFAAASFPGNPSLYLLRAV